MSIAAEIKWIAATVISGIGTAVGKSLSFLDTHAAALGVIIAFTSLMIAWYYQRRALKIKKKESEAYIKSLDKPPI